MDITRHLATTLKTLRQARGWSLSKLADETGVSKAMLGQIERNESSPTVSTLWKIATGLNVPFSAFITPEADRQAVFDHFSITLAPGALSESTPHEAGVIEHVVVISGELEMKLEGKWQTISADSGVRFAGDKPHAYRNSSDRTVHFHSLIHYPR